LPLVTPGSPFTIAVSGQAGSTVLLQRSANLRDWEDWVVLPLGEYPIELADPDADTSPSGFYRAVEP
jgi:hypothetical protein